MAQEQLVIVTHLSDWLERDSTQLKESFVEWMDPILKRLVDSDFEPWNIAKALEYNLTDQGLKDMRSTSRAKIEQCDGLIKIPQQNASETLGEDTGFAMGLGKKVMIAASGEFPLGLTDTEDIKDGKKFKIASELNPDEIRAILV